MSATASSSRGSAGSEEVEVSGRGRGIRAIDLPAVFTTTEEREMLSVITAFDLSRNELQELTNLQPLRSLLRLNASYNHISRFDGLPLLLTQLNLAHNKLEHLDYVGQLTHLRELDVSFNRLTSLAGLTPRVPLEVLKAEDNRIGRTMGLEGVNTLRVLSLSNNYIEDKDELLFLPTTPALQLLSLTGNPVTRLRRYRVTVAQLQPALVSLDGAPLLRDEDTPEASRPPAAQHRRAEKEGAQETDGAAQAETTLLSSSVPISATSATNRRAVPPQRSRPTHRAASQHRLNVSVEQRSTAATQTAAAAPLDTADTSLDSSVVMPRAEVPRPVARVSAGTSPLAPASNTATTASVRSLTKPTFSAARGGASVSRRDGHVTPHRASQTSPTDARTSAKGSTAREQQEASVRRVRRPAAAAAGAPAPTSPPSAVSSYSAVHLSKKPPQLSPSRSKTEDEAAEEEPVIEQSRGEVVSNDDTHGAVAATTPGASQQASQMVNADTPGYAALHLTPASVSPSPWTARSNQNSRSFITRSGACRGAGDGGAGSGRFGRLTSCSPASLQRSAASQELDSTTAQLHDSLVVKEQLQRECQTLRQRVKHVEGQLTEARRVISQQLAELSQTRLERDTLRQSEAETLERLEKERRSAKARAAHHTEEVQTLQLQYERMKTFYEAQLADTRRELSAERARLLHRARSPSRQETQVNAEEDNKTERGKSEAHVLASTLTADKSFKSPGPAAALAPETPAAQLQTTEQQPSPPPATLLSQSPQARSPPSTQHQQPPAVESNAEFTTAASASRPPRLSSAAKVLEEEVARQLTSWLNASVTSNATRDAEGEQSTADEQSLAYLKKLLEGQQTAMKADNVATAGVAPSQPQPLTAASAAAARTVLEDYVAQYTHQTTTTPPRGTTTADPPTTSASVQREGLPEGAPRPAVAPLTTPPQLSTPPPLPPQPSTPVAAIAIAAMRSPTSATTAALVAAEGLKIVEESDSGTAEEVVRVDEAQELKHGGEEEEEESGDTESEDTVLLSAPPLECLLDSSAAAAATTAATTPALMPAVMSRDERVNAAKSLLKEMASMFEEDSQGL